MSLSSHLSAEAKYEYLFSKFYLCVSVCMMYVHVCMQVYSPVHMEARVCSWNVIHNSFAIF